MFKLRAKIAGPLFLKVFLKGYVAKSMLCDIVKVIHRPFPQRPVKLF